MIGPLEHRQRIAHLTPLEDVMQWIAQRVQPAAPREIPVAAALGSTLAQDIVVEHPHPAAPLALIDGWAVHAELTADAGPYAPTVLSHLQEIAVGGALPVNSDAVAPLDAVTWRAGSGQVHAAMTPGDGVLMPGTDAGAGELLRPAGHQLRASDVAAMQALGITGARVRKPRVRVARAGYGPDDITDAIAGWLAHAITADGGEPVATTPGRDVQAVLTGDEADATAMVGGTGAGPCDNTVHVLRRIGAVDAHGIAVSPGETAAFGIAHSRPVLVMPGRLDAALAVWLLIGRAMVARLRGAREHVSSHKSTLIGKIVSTIGLTELVLVRHAREGVEPLASKYLPLATVAQADGWIVIPAASEGLPSGARVAVYPLP